MLSKSRSSKEIADTQAALQFGSIKNGYVFINDACRSIKERIKKSNLKMNKTKCEKKITEKNFLNEIVHNAIRNDKN